MPAGMHVQESAAAGFARQGGFHRDLLQIRTFIPWDVQGEEGNKPLLCRKFESSGLLQSLALCLQPFDEKRTRLCSQYVLKKRSQITHGRMYAPKPLVCSLPLNLGQLA